MLQVMRLEEERLRLEVSVNRQGSFNDEDKLANLRLYDEVQRERSFYEKASVENAGRAKVFVRCRCLSSCLMHPRSLHSCWN